MRQQSISNDQNTGQVVQNQLKSRKHESRFDSDGSLPFEFQTIVPSLAKNGFALLPGLTHWLDELRPSNHAEAWEVLHNKNIIEIIRSCPQQQARYFLNDSGTFDCEPQLGTNFAVKDEKSHLTVVEGSQAVCNYPLLPAAVRLYLKCAYAFISELHHMLAEILPIPTLPVVLKVRVFEYRASDLLTGMRPFKSRNDAMRPHTDGSVVTIVIANSDGLLKLWHRGNWHSAVRSNLKPFSLAIPGVAAIHDLGIRATPHMVLAGGDRRPSVTAFLTPAFSGDRKLALAQLDRWRLQSPSDGIPAMT